MTILEYIRQLPGMAEKYAFECGCPNDYGFDHQKCTGHCGDCLYAEDTINGKPVPYIFDCPVKPGQKVYIVWENGIDERTIDEVRFDKGGWYAIEYNHEENEYAIVARPSVWDRQVFSTREEAQNGIEAYRAGK